MTSETNIMEVIIFKKLMVPKYLMVSIIDWLVFLLYLTISYTSSIFAIVKLAP